MLARLSAFVIWGLVAATAVFWGLRLLVRAPSSPPYAVAVGDVGAVRGDLTRLLGAAPVNAPATVAAPATSSRFRLLGIMAPKAVGSAAAAGQGVALIAVDGKMPKAYAVGAHVDNDLVLQSVSLRTVSIGSDGGAPRITLELPPPAPPAVGTLSVGGSGAAPPPALALPPSPGATLFPPKNPAPVPQLPPAGGAVPRPDPNAPAEQ